MGANCPIKCLHYVTMATQLKIYIYSDVLYENNVYAVKKMFLSEFSMDKKDMQFKKSQNW